MPGQTKLYQRAGSPLIMGHSRYERAVWVDWLLGALIGGAAVVVALAVATLIDPARPYLETPEDIAAWVRFAGPGLLSAAIASGIAAWFGHRAGWRKPWVAAAVAGAVIGVAGMAAGWRLL